MNQKYESTQSVVVECELPEPPEKVWRALTESALLAQWLLPNDIRPEVGQRFRFQAGRGAEHGERIIDCEVLAAETNRLLRYSWRSGENAANGRGESVDSVVSFELTKTAAGTHLRVVHRGIAASVHQPSATRKPTAAILGIRRGEVRRRTRHRQLRWAA